MDLANLVGETGQVWVLVKVLYLVAFGLYVVFAVVVWRQIALMSRTLKGALEVPLKMVGVGLIFGAVLAMLWAVMLL